MFSKEVQLYLPNSFPDDGFQGFMAASRSILLNPKGPLWREFAGASNLVVWRYRSFSDDLDAYVNSWHASGAAAPFEEQYYREKMLFGVFAASVSCLESLSYALYALASDNQLLGIPFGLKEQRACSPKKLCAVLKGPSKARALGDALEVMVKSPEWNLLLALRNRMSHRSSLPRIIKGAIGAVPPTAKVIEVASTSSTPGVAGDVDWFEEKRKWVAKSIKEQFEAATKLVQDA